MVRRLFSLTDIFDGWKTGKKVSDKPHIASLNDVTLYTSLESCAQCSGVMSLAGVKQIVYLQNDFTAYKIGNIMYNLANRGPAVDSRGNAILDWQGKHVPSLPGAPIPIAGSEIQLDEFKKLNDANLAVLQEHQRRRRRQARPISAAHSSCRRTASPISTDSITSFLCTDAALKIFEDGGAKLDTPDARSRFARLEISRQAGQQGHSHQPAVPAEGEGVLRLRRHRRLSRLAAQAVTV